MTRPIARGLLAAAALTLSVAAASAHAQDARRPFDVNDLVRLERVSDPRLSPDGRYVAYSLRTTDYEANRGVNAIWIVDLNARTPAPRRLAASDGGASSPRWGADGRLYFLSSRSGSSQVWRTDADGATATQVTDLAIDVEAFVLSPDAKKLAVGLSTRPGCTTPRCTVEAREAAAREAGKATGVAHDRVFVRHWDAWSDGERNHLYVLQLNENGRATGHTAVTAGLDADVPTKPFGDDADFAFTRDGSALIFSAKIAGKTEPWSTNYDLWRTPADGSAAPVSITADNPAWDAGPVISPDGTQLAYRAMSRPGFEADRWRIMVRALATGATREVAAGWDRSADRIEWSADGKTLFAEAQDVGQTKLFAIDLASDRVRPLTGEGRVTAFAVGRDRIVFAQDDLDSPAQLFRAGLDGRRVQRLTTHNDQLMAGLATGAFEQFSFPGWNGGTVYGYVVKPVDAQPGRKYPVAFLIHGGPQGSFGNQFHYRWNPQTYAGKGYAVVMIDFHGSTGYGQAFTDSISQHWGDRPLEDLQKGWDAALARYDFLDGERACALGGSYGGFMVAWMAGRWNGPWDCFVNHSGIFDTRAMGYATEELWFTEWENGGPVFQNPEAYERFNPVLHVDQWSKPMLVIHGQRDYRVPVEQGLAAFNALQRRGIESRFLYFPDENHWILKPQNSVQWHREVEAWLDRWAKY